MDAGIMSDTNTDRQEPWLEYRALTEEPKAPSIKQIVGSAISVAVLLVVAGVLAIIGFAMATDGRIVAKQLFGVALFAAAIAFAYVMIRNSLRDLKPQRFD
ncbi:MAG: hypothetical protein AAGK78_12090 [Planctomycetota bacterium]